MEEIVLFSDLNLSEKTLKGMNENGYTNPTKIQKESIEQSFLGKDILGSAKTGSGKTLAFVIPILEVLFQQKFSKLDGAGAIILSPTRELAYQTFEVLRKIGKYHELSAGLVIGGKSIKDEEKYLRTTNIIICTPGRLLQHMDQTQFFDCSNLKLLVIDEVDKMLEMDFLKTINQIIDNLPDERQTLLFSATLSKDVFSLAKLSSKEPHLINICESSNYSLPDKLIQLYSVCELDKKLNFLYSFIKTHLKSKIIVFLSCCKEARFVYESFCTFRPGTPLLALHGSQKQQKRLKVFDIFSKKPGCVLLCTDLASRGLDFPSVDWVIQLDCPSDVRTYIHRVGRTARFNNDGKALLVLLPSEEKFISLLEGEDISIDRIYPKDMKLMNLRLKLESFCAKSNTNKFFAEQCFRSYVKSVYFQSNKRIFKISKLPLADYAKSLGLISTPELKFMKNKVIIPQSNPSKLNEEVSSDDDFLQPHKTPREINEVPLVDSSDQYSTNKASKNVTKAKLAKRALKRGIQINTKIIFDKSDTEE